MKSTYELKLDRIIEEWQKETISDEWLFAQFRESHVSTMGSEKAFKALECTITRLLDVCDEDTFIELAQTVIDLARRSESTESPEILRLREVELREKTRKYGNYAKDKITELFSHYRMNPRD